jgi:hypothetical protein
MDNFIRCSVEVSHFHDQKPNLGLIKRTFVSRGKHITKRLYIALLRPTLEYGNSARPTTQFVGDMDKKEKVQRRATKLCTEQRDLP